MQVQMFISQMILSNLNTTMLCCHFLDGATPLCVLVEVWTPWVLSSLVEVVVCAVREMAAAAGWCVQDYITRRLQTEHDQIEEDERLVRQYRDETQKMRSQIEQLKTT